MSAAADCEYTKQYRGTQNATQQLLTNYNTVSLSTFNISLGIVEMQVQEGRYVPPSPYTLKRKEPPRISLMI